MHTPAEGHQSRTVDLISLIDVQRAACLAGVSCDDVVVRGGGLQIGVPMRVRGVYVAHWEFGGLILSSRWRLATVRCELVAGPGVADVFEVAAIAAPDNRRDHPGLRLDVEAVVTPIEHGRFGHMGMSAWRVRVDEWISVTPQSEASERRRAVGCFVPFLGLSLAIVLVVLTVLSLPNSSPPSEGAAVSAAAVFWASTMVALAAGAWWGRARSSIRRRWSAPVVIGASLAVLGMWVSSRFDTAWLDGCQFSAAAPTRCVTGDGGAPAFVSVVWPLLGLLVGALFAGIATPGNDRRSELPAA